MFKNTSQFWSANGNVSSPFSSSAPTKYGKTIYNGCYPCSTSNTLCGPVGAGGQQLKQVPCSEAGQKNCYYNTLEECSGGRPSQTALVKAMNTVPFNNVLQASYDQTSYVAAQNTFMSGQIQ